MLIWLEDRVLPSLSNPVTVTCASCAVDWRFMLDQVSSLGCQLVFAEVNESSSFCSLKRNRIFHWLTAAVSSFQIKLGETIPGGNKVSFKGYSILSWPRDAAGTVDKAVVSLESDLHAVKAQRVETMKANVKSVLLSAAWRPDGDCISINITPFLLIFIRMCRIQNVILF